MGEGIGDEEEDTVDGLVRPLGRQDNMQITVDLWLNIKREMEERQGKERRKRGHKHRVNKNDRDKQRELVTSHGGKGTVWQTTVQMIGGSRMI